MLRVFMMSLVTCLLISAGVAGRTQAQEKFVETFEGTAIDKQKWRLPKAPVSATAETTTEAKSRFIKRSDGALTFVLPPNEKKREQFMVASKFGLVNDFTIQMSYNLLGGLPDPAAGGYVNIELTVSGADGSAHLARTRHSKFGEGVSLFFRPSEKREGELKKRRQQSPDGGKSQEFSIDDGQEMPAASSENIRMWRFKEMAPVQGTLELRRRGGQLIAFANGEQVGGVPLGASPIEGLTFGVVIQGDTDRSFEADVTQMAVESMPTDRSTPAVVWLTIAVTVCTTAFVSWFWVRRRTSRATTRRALKPPGAKRQPIDNKQSRVKDDQPDIDARLAESIDDFDVT